MKGRLALLASLTLRNLRRRGMRTFLTVSAVVLAVGAMIMLEAFMQAWTQGAFDREISSLTGHGQLHAPGYLDDPGPEASMPSPSQKLLEALDSPAVAAWAPRIVAPVLIRTERENAPAMLYGIDPGRERQVSFFGSDALAEGEVFADAESGGIVIGRVLAERLEVRLGRRVVLTTQDVQGALAEVGVPVVGIYGGRAELQGRTAFVSLGTARNLYAMDSDISEIAFLAADENAVPETAERLRASAPNLEVSTWDALRPFMKAMVEMHASMNAVWIAVSFILVSIGLVNTLMLAVHERRREFALMRALGMSPGLLLGQVLLESLFLLAAGTVLGVGAGALIVGSYADGLDLGVWGEGSAYFGGTQVLYPDLDWTQLAVACGVVVALSLAASLYPAWRASRTSPIDAMTRAET